MFLVNEGDWFIPSPFLKNLLCVRHWTSMVQQRWPPKIEIGPFPRLGKPWALTDTSQERSPAHPSLPASRWPL